MIAETVEGLQTTTRTHAIKATGNATRFCYGDEKQLEQVARILLANAIKYAPNSPEVLLHINEVSNFLKVAITDYGPGIKKIP